MHMPEVYAADACGRRTGRTHTQRERRLRSSPALT
jgi:hypothetical protein